MWRLFGILSAQEVSVPFPGWASLLALNYTSIEVISFLAFGMAPVTTLEALVFGWEEIKDAGDPSCHNNQTVLQSLFCSWWRGMMGIWVSEILTWRYWSDQAHIEKLSTSDSIWPTGTCGSRSSGGIFLWSCQLPLRISNYNHFLCESECTQVMIIFSSLRQITVWGKVLWGSGDAM